MQDNSSALAIVREAFSQGAQRAESQLLVIGKEGGDEALALVTKDLSAAEIFALAMNGDVTKSSIAMAFATPQQFSEAFSYFGSNRLNEIEELIRDLVDFLYPFLFEGGHERRVEMAQALIAHRLGMKTICSLGLLDVGFLEFLSSDVHTAQVPHGSWQEILLFIKEASPETFERVHKWANEKFPKGYNQKEAFSYLTKLRNELKEEAEKKVGSSKEQEKGPSKDTFVDI